MELPCDGKFAGDSRGNISGFRFLQTPCYLFCLRAAFLVTGDEKWEKKYRAALRERNPRAAPDAPARLEICARGYRQDEGWLKNIDAVFLWIYVKNYAALRALFDAETESPKPKGFSARALKGARRTPPARRPNAKNSTIQKTGNSNWRIGEETSASSPKTPRRKSKRLRSDS